VLAVLHDEEMRLAVALEVVVPVRAGKGRCRRDRMVSLGGQLGGGGAR